VVDLVVAAAVIDAVLAVDLRLELAGRVADAPGVARPTDDG
jgi:hypothetical protein